MTRSRLLCDSIRSYLFGTTRFVEAIRQSYGLTDCCLEIFASKSLHVTQVGASQVGSG